MAYPINKWDLIPVFGVYMVAPGETPVKGRVEFRLSQRITRADGRTIYPDGASVEVEIGKPEDQDATVRAAVRTAWRAADEAAQGEEFDASAWDVWWDTVVLPAAIFTGFPASDDPDVTPTGWTVTVAEALTGAAGRTYAIQPLLAHLESPIPGINLGTVEVPPGSPTNPAPVYAKGIAGGVAGLDADGDVVDAAGEKVLSGGGGGGGAVASVNGKTGVVVLNAGDVGGATSAQGAKADSAVQPAALASKADDAAVVKLAGAQTVTGVKTFSSAPVVPDGSFAQSKIAGLVAALGGFLSKVTSAAPQLTPGWWLKLSLTAYDTGSSDEPLLVEGFRDGEARRAFWLNENGSPRGASVNSEPAMKLFGPDADPAYAGLLFQIQKRRGDQEHKFGVRADGRLSIGTGMTPASPAVILTVGDTIPAGLPANTLIVWKP